MKKKKKRKCNGTSIHQWQQQPRRSAHVLPVVALNIKWEEEGGEMATHLSLLACFAAFVCVARATLKRHTCNVCVWVKQGEREWDNTEICRQCWFYCFSYPSLNVATKIHDTPRQRRRRRRGAWRVDIDIGRTKNTNVPQIVFCCTPLNYLWMIPSMHTAGANKISLIFCSVRKSSRMISIKSGEGGYRCCLQLLLT